MNPEAIIAWTALYIAVGACALICAALAIVVTIHELVAQKWRPRFQTKADWLLAAPKVWLRWQRNYLLGAPVILAIALGFVCHTGFDKFWNIEPTDQTTPKSQNEPGVAEPPRVQTQRSRHSP